MMNKAVWLKPEVYPLLLAVGLGCLGSGYMIGRTLAIHPDITINKNKPFSFLRVKEGENYDKLVVTDNAKNSNK